MIYETEIWPTLKLTYNGREYIIGGMEWTILK